VEAIRTSIETGDADTLTRVTHQVRGAAGGYGYPQITTIAAQVEDTLRGGATCDQVEASVYDLLGLCLAAIEGGDQ
jgi:HPt (histidine-containing phosphotransfer) domain-containing protein